MSSMDSALLDPFAPRCRNRMRLLRWRAGELSDAEAGALRTHVAGCAACQSVVQELDADDTAARVALPWSVIQDRIKSPTEQFIPLARRRLGPRAVAMVALAAGLVAWVLAPHASRRAERRNDTKGGVGLEVFVGGVGRSHRVSAPSLELSKGQRVRLQVRGAGHRFVAVVSVDDHGAVSPIYFAGEQSMALPAEPTILPRSIDFSGAGKERLVVLLSDSPLARSLVERAAGAAFARAGGLSGMGPLRFDDPVEEIDRTVFKAGSP